MMCRHELFIALLLTIIPLFVSPFQTRYSLITTATKNSIIVPSIKTISRPSSSPRAPPTPQRCPNTGCLRSSNDHTNDSTDNNGNNNNNNNNNNKRRKKKNKYANFSKADKMAADPFDTLVSQSEAEMRRLEKETIARKKGLTLPTDDDTEDNDEIDPNEKRERNKRIFPDVSTIDPYDPSTYGYVELGTILGAHGVHGLVKVTVVTGFPIERLCQPGIRHLKAPNRRSPREVRLMEGRLRLGDEYLVRLEGIDGRDEANRLRGSVLYARQEERPEDLGEDEYMVTDLVGLEVHLVTGYMEDAFDLNEDEVDHPVNIGEVEGLAKDVDLDIEYDMEMNLDMDMDMENIDMEMAMGMDIDINMELPKGTYVGTVRGIILAEEMCSIPGLGHDMLEITLPRGKGGTPSWRDEMVMVPIVPEIVPTIDTERGIIYIDPPLGLLDLTYVQEEKVRVKALLPPAKDP